MELGIAVRDEGGRTVVSVTGELDAFTAPALEDRLLVLIEKDGADLVVDLTEVTFLDSTGLGALVKALKWCREHDGRLQVVADADRIVKVFTITGLADAMSLTSSVEGALSR